MLKKHNLLHLITYGFALISVFCSAVFAGTDEIGEISFILGEVVIINPDSSEEAPAEMNSIIRTGDRIVTAEESRCEIKLKDESVIRLGENTEFDVSDVTLKENSLQGKAGLNRGSLWNNLIKLKTGDKNIRVKTPTSVMAVRGTVFRVEAQGDTSTSLLVYDGVVDVNLSEEVAKAVGQIQDRKPGPPKAISGPKKVHGPYEVTLDEWKRIVAGMQINVRSDGKYHQFEFDSATDMENEWVKWNLERDRMINR